MSGSLGGREGPFEAAEGRCLVPLEPSGMLLPDDEGALLLLALTCMTTLRTCRQAAVSGSAQGLFSLHV